MNDRRKQTEQLVAKARAVLLGRDMDIGEAYALSKELIGLDAHYWARRLLLKMLSRRDLERASREQLAQGLALATYKDPTLLRDQAFDKALEVLAGEFDLSSTNDQETLGLVGSIYKRRWRVDGQREWLERSLHYYRRGFKCGVTGDDGYTAVNAAFAQDALACLEEKVAKGGALPGLCVDERHADARNIREHILAKLGEDVLALDSSEPQSYWPMVTLAEVYFGLGRFAEAGEQLARAAAVPGVADWMRKTTVEQLVHLTEIGLQTCDPETVSRSQQWAALSQLIGNSAPAVLAMFSGKVGLALSGGGFRASLYHLGVLAKLAELDILRHVEVLSCVSGGSIVGAHYYLELRRLMQFAPCSDNRLDRGRRDDEIAHEDYITLVKKLIDDFLDGVQKNIRVRVLANPLANLKMLFLPTYSRTEYLGELYERHLYSRVDDRPSNPDTVQKSDTRPKRCRKPHRWLNELYISPPDEEPGFTPLDVNWRRSNKVPQLVLNATTLNTGHVWQFTASWMGETPNIIDRDVDKNTRYRRFYFQDAPPGYECYRLGHAVAASSCVPGLFEPIELPSLYEKTNVRLVDGGVYDNLGAVSLAEQDCSVMIVSDASGQLGTDDDPKGGMLGPLMRSISVMMHRIRGAEYDDLRMRRRNGLLKSAAFVHLTQGLEGADLDWKGCELPGEGRMQDSLTTPYGIRCDVQERLAGVRTDLDSFSDLEAYALMNSGYHAMDEAAKNIKGFPLKHDNQVQWKFCELEAPMTSAVGAGTTVTAAKLDRHMRVAHMKFFKVWRLSPWLFGIAIVAALALLGWISAWVVEAWHTNPEMKLLATAPAKRLTGWFEEILTLKNVVVSMVVLAGGYLAMALVGKTRGKQLKQFFKLRSIVQRAVVGTGLAGIGFIGAAIHLWAFDRLFLKLGRIRNRDR